MASLKFKIEGKPVPNNTKKGRYSYYKPSQCVKYTKQVQIEAIKEKLATRFKLSEKPIMLICWIFLESPKSWSKKKKELAYSGYLKHTVKPDASNIYYLIENALKGIIYKDDAQVCCSVCKKKYSQSPYVKIEIIEL